MRRLALLFVFGLTFFGQACGSAFAQAEKVVEVESRGQKIRALLIVPENPAGSVILLAGGHGKLDISPSGKIGWGDKNQLVRTRAAYAEAGYAVLVTDIAPDLKTPTGVVSYYRGKHEYTLDLAASVRFMRKIKEPVVMIGTSLGSLSAANAATRLKGKDRPDAAVLTSAFLSPIESGESSVRRLAQDDPAYLDLPILVVEHREDGCNHTPPANVEPFRSWYEKNGRKLDVVWMEGGLPPKSDACNALSPHGFYGLDDQVVSRIAGWIKAQNLPLQ